MNRGFDPRLAWTGMKQNRRLYLPYLLTCTGVTAMFYILMGLSVSSVLPQMSGGRSTALIMSLGSMVIAFFALIFLFYTHSFLIRRRSREFGLYNVLGMGKGNIARILLWETLLSCGATTLIGLALGILLSKLAEVALLKLLHLRITYTFTVSIPSLLLTLGLFAAIHALIFLRSLWELHRVSAVALCRMLQKNPRYYYQPRHFVSVSSMAYRMKRNGAGLASICVLATMVLVMLSSTTCMYYGVEDALHQRYPRDIGVECYFGDRLDQMDEAHLDILRAAVADAADAMGSSRDNVQDYRAAWLYGILTPDGALRSASASDSGGLASEMTRVTLISLPDYNALTGTELTLSDGEVYVYGHRMTYTAPQFTVGDTTWRVKSLLDRCAVNGASAADVTPSLYVVVPDFESAARLLLDLSANSDLSVQLRWYYQFDSDLPDDAQHSGSASYEEGGTPRNLTDALQLALYSVNAETGLTTGWEVESLAANRSDFYGAYGGLFFLGIMLSVVFSLAAVSIIYYKQVCEGYEDQSRFAIMQKVGMTKRDIRRSINSQLLTVFFLPMALSGVHLCFAFPFIHKLLLLFNLSNTSLLIGTTVVCYVAFALLYTLAYKLTSNAYYHIVSGAAERE